MTKKIPYTLDNSNLYYAAEVGDLEMVKQLITAGANPNYQEIQYTVLQRAVLSGYVSVVEWLLQNGADPNLRDSEAKATPLMDAKSGEMVELLARYGADPYLNDRRRNTALFYYAENNYIDAAKTWIKLGWRSDYKERKLHNSLLAKKRFDMLSVITGFSFKEESSIAKIAEFKAQWGKRKGQGLVTASA